MQIIERSLPKKQIVKKEPFVIVKEESEKTYKLWQYLATKSIPKHHRNFTSLMKKRQVDAKRFSDSCQREVLCPFILLPCTVPFSCNLVYIFIECMSEISR
jgi:hypothetical protein